VLVLNAGSSSLKYSLVDVDAGTAPAAGMVERIGTEQARLQHRGPGGEDSSDRPVADHAQALHAALEAFAEHGPDLQGCGLVAVGHRVVHGGERFSSAVLLDDDVTAAIDELSALAPLHQPPNLEGIRLARRAFPDLPHVAVFDTAFHSTLPPRAYTYAVPRQWEREHGVRRYGFHGTSHAYVSREAVRFLGLDPQQANVVVLHLGNGASACAVAGGRSIDTSMGLTPLQGLVMGSRSGDLDPAVVAHLVRTAGMTLDEVDEALNRASGLQGLAGDNDLRAVEQAAEQGDAAAVLALDVYCYRIRQYVGAYYATLGRVDVIAFTGGVGENSARTRTAVLTGLQGLGIELDEVRNQAQDTQARRISTHDSHVAVLVLPTNEELEIARQSVAVLDCA